MTTNRTLLMLTAPSLVVLMLVLAEVGWIGLLLFAAGWGLGWLTAS